LHPATRWQILVPVGVVAELVEGEVYHWARSWQARCSARFPSR
jgi:hypothetical protein